MLNACSCCQRIVVCCSVLQCVAVCCSALPCVAVRCCVLQMGFTHMNAQWHEDFKRMFVLPAYCSVSQCIAVCCSVLQCVAVRCCVLQMGFTHMNAQWREHVKHLRATNMCYAQCHENIKCVYVRLYINVMCTSNSGVQKALCFLFFRGQAGRDLMKESVC